MPPLLKVVCCLSRGSEKNRVKRKSKKERKKKKSVSVKKRDV